MTKKKPAKKEEPKKEEETKIVKPDQTEEHQKTEIIRVMDSREIAPEQAFGKLTRAQIELIKRTIAVGASDDELRVFLQTCKVTGLNPMMKQVHLVPFWDSKSGTERRSIIVGIDGFRSIAEKSGGYAGNDDAVFDGEEEIDVEQWEGSGQARKMTGKVKKKVPAKATVTVWKIIDGQRYAFTASARWSEYYPGGKKGARWQAMPYAMLAKCAEALALRKAFPILLGGMYAQEEMDQAMKAGEEEAKIAKGFATLMQALANPNVTEAQISEFKSKIQASEKYTVEQKAEFITAADARLKKISEAKKKKPIEGEVVGDIEFDSVNESP